ncbi:ATPase family protein [Oesophagostomum dentatum]|uniref:ATPase family protein n=1 Tax=Oesophagostomum dentatum TaxID=61180 RepID=A0A0B1TMA6_OESDE|nr:ATPase family protein [Oesophagostomum dentatum]
MISILPAKILKDAQRSGYDVDQLEVLDINSTTILDASNNVMNFLGATIVEIELVGGRKHDVAFHVSQENDNEILLGTNALAALGVDLTLKVRDQQQPAKEGTARVSRRVLIQPYETKLVRVKCEGMDLDGREEMVLWPSRKEVPSGVFSVTEREAKVPVFNAHSEPMLLSQEEELGSWGTNKWYDSIDDAGTMMLDSSEGDEQEENKMALASLFGRQVLVFNCDEGIDVHSMRLACNDVVYSRIFIGIVQCGAWGCFDEFNRLDQTVLSAVSMQIQTIQDVIKSKSGTCTLGGKTVKEILGRPATVDSNAAIFVTLNPAGKGYGGRQKLPDNLKQLFRPVVMSIPDNDIIAETILYSEGFTEARTLARKIVTIFMLSKEMLSAQQHYDWGLRALKVVLRGCGDLRAAKPETSETDIVVQALLLNTLSKLTSSDSKRFSVLIDDIFSSVNKEMATFGDLVEPLKTASAEMNVQLTEKQLQKVFQLYEQLRQRIGVVVVGPTGSGKSTIWRILKRAQVLAGVALKTVSFNPKAMNRTKLLGHMDIDTREWSDGILTMVAREVVKDTSVHTWIVFDGDIDPEWIEALNSVLDDNRLLTMPSGERIQFGSNVNFLFETDSLEFASPATVSRMGMIFISEEDVSAREVVAKWVNSLSDEHVDLPDWVEQHFYRQERVFSKINVH